MRKLTKTHALSTYDFLIITYVFSFSKYPTQKYSDIMKAHTLDWIILFIFCSTGLKREYIYHTN